jgi:hypothetical protein
VSAGIDFSDLSVRFKVSEDFLERILKDLSDRNEIDKELWQKHRAIFSQKFIESIQDAYKQRKNKCITRAEVLGLCSQPLVLHTDNGRFHTDNIPGMVDSMDVLTQSKVKQSKEEKSKEEVPLADLRKLDAGMVAKANDLTDALCEYFDVKKILTSPMYDNVLLYVTTLSHRNELDIGARALQNYIAYKARSQEQKHSLKSWIGQREDYYRNGQWLMVDWDKKNRNYHDRRTDKTATPTASAIITNGKSAGSLRPNRTE